MRVRIPADVERPDALLGGLSARQLAILATAAVAIWAVWSLTRRVLPLPVFAALASPLAAGAVALALGRRDGLSADRYALAAWHYLRSPGRQVRAPEGVAAPPAWVRGLPRVRTWVWAKLIINGVRIRWNQDLCHP